MRTNPFVKNKTDCFLIFQFLDISVLLFFQAAWNPLYTLFIILSHNFNGNHFHLRQNALFGEPQTHFFDGVFL